MRILTWLNKHLEEYICGALLVCILSAAALQVFMRYVAQNALSWTEEFARYCFVWLAFMGTSLAAKHKDHIRITMLFEKASPTVQYIASLFADAMFLIFSVIITYHGAKSVMSQIAFPQLSAALQIPMWIVYVACPVGFTLTAFREIQAIVSTIKEGPSKFTKAEEGLVETNSEVSEV
jgi:TRAP-type C4-dicarboxylate transport system permease small subunit